MSDEFEVWAQFGELLVQFGEDEVVVHGPNTDPATATEIEPTPQALRTWTSVDDLGRDRPLPTARTMRSGWLTRFATLDDFAQGLGAIYPLAQEHIAAREAAALQVVPLDEVLRRAAGDDHGTRDLDAAGRQLASEVLCRQCVRTPLWEGGAPEFVEPENLIPCPEACEVMVALCREAARWQDDPPELSDPDPMVPFAAFSEQGNAARELYLRLRKARS